MIKKKVGVRFCGGCNPTYDRSKLAQRLTKKHKEWDVSIAEEGKHYDLILVIGGCTSCCASYEQFDSNEVIKIREDVDDI